MASKGVSILKFVGTVSLGLLTVRSLHPTRSSPCPLSSYPSYN